MADFVLTCNNTVHWSGQGQMIEIYSSELFSYGSMVHCSEMAHFLVLPDKNFALRLTLKGRLKGTRKINGLLLMLVVSSLASSRARRYF